MVLNQNEDVANIKKIEKQQTDNSYRERIQKALTLLFKNRRKYLTPKALEIYSPKFKRVLLLLIIILSSCLFSV